MGDASSPAVAAQQQVLAKQLQELKTLRQDMQTMYDSSQQEVVDARAEAAEAKVEAARERERAATVSAENAGLRRWNETLAAELASMRSELLRGAAASADELGLRDDAEEAEAAHLLAAAADEKSAAAPAAATGVSVDISTLQQVQLEASATALRLTHAHARLKRRGKELRASEQRMGQLQITAQALAADLASATAQIGKLEQRMRQQAETSRQLAQLTTEHAALSASLERTTVELARAREEHSALAHGPLAAAERSASEHEERERRMRIVLERKVRQTAEMAAAVQTLGADSRVRIEENVRLRLLAQRLGATKKELERGRRTPAEPTAEGLAGSAFGAGGARERAAERLALATAWVPLHAEDQPSAAGGGGSVDAAAAAAHEAVDAMTAAHEAAAAHEVAAASPPIGRRARPHAGCYGASSSLSSVASTRAPPTAATAVSTARYSTPADALQSQTALQEKLKRVRNTFADIRRQVGYADD